MQLILKINLYQFLSDTCDRNRTWNEAMENLIWEMSVPQVENEPNILVYLLSNVNQYLLPKI